jgi:hypothetical protein
MHRKGAPLSAGRLTAFVLRFLLARLITYFLKMVDQAKNGRIKRALASWPRRGENDLERIP